MNKKVDDEFVGIKDVYTLQCICTELKETIHKKEAMYDSFAVDYRLAQEEIEGLTTELDKTRLSELDKEYRINKAIEYIDKNTEFNHDGDDYGYMEWVDIINVNTQTFIKELLEILDKENK